MISIVIPVYNEAQHLPHTISAILDICKTLSYDYELIIVNDGSGDHSRECITQFAQNPHVKGINFTRNFGKEIALTA